MTDDQKTESLVTLNEKEQGPFTKSGFKNLKEKITTFADDLIVESNRIAKRHGTDDISAVHVEAANRHLVTSSRNKTLAIIGSIGGICLGGSLSNVFNILNGTSASTTSIVVTTGLGIAGAFLMAVQFARS